MEITKRQALIMIVICFLSNKVQRLPSLISSNLGRHGWLVFLIMGLIEVLFVLLALWFNKLAGTRTTYNICERAGGKVYAKIISALFAVYFFANILLPFEATHDIFANVLFEHLSWALYGTMLIVTVGYMASLRLRNLGRISELFFIVIVVCFIILLGFGANTTNFSRVLPFVDIDLGKTLTTCVKYDLWFSDFLILYMFVGKIKQDDKKLGCSIITALIISTLSLCFAYIVFYGLYENLSIDQYSLISSISQFSLLDLDIGRVDWFVVLFFEISTLISSAIYIYMCSYSLSYLFNVNKKKLFIVIVSTLVYILDVFLFKSLQEGADLVAHITKYIGIFMITILPIILLLTGYVVKLKDNKVKNNMHQSLRKYCELSREYKVNKGYLSQNEFANINNLKKPQKLDNGGDGL